MSDLPELVETRVNSWKELSEILYDIPKSEHDRHRSKFVYRGVANKSWSLVTSLIRLGEHHAAVERPLLRNFRKYAEPGSIPSSSLWVQLAVAQHHGLPTRLLDWTVSPRVALHFATFEERNFDKDGAIWCVDVPEARNFLPSRLRQILDEESAFLFSVEMLESIQRLSEFDAMGLENPFVMFFEPPSLDGRIVNQGAVMSVMSGASLDLQAFLRRHPNVYRKYIIPKEIKWEIRDKLDQDNITERMLFPGLDGLSKWLTRYYGPGPNKCR
jgi:FRG domain